MSAEIVIPASVAAGISLLTTVVIGTLRGQRATDERYMTRSDCTQAHKLCDAECAKCKMERDEHARHQARDLASAGALERASLAKELSDIKTTLAGMVEMQQHLMRLVEQMSATKTPAPTNRGGRGSADSD